MGFAPLTKEERKKCWVARDRYFLCLDKAAASGQDSSSQETTCAEAKKKFIEDCPLSWAEHFIVQKEAEAKKKAFEEKMLNPELK